MRRRREKMKKRWILPGACILIAAGVFWLNGAGQEKGIVKEPEKTAQEITAGQRQADRSEEKEKENMGREKTEALQPEGAAEDAGTQGHRELVFQGFYKEAFQVMGIPQPDVEEKLEEWADKNGYSGEKEAVFGHTVTVNLSEGRYSVDLQMYQKGGGNGIGMAIGDKRFVMDYYEEDGAVYFH